MLFRRRKPPDLSERLRTLVWPRRSVRRSLQYFAKRALRLSATPHAIAAGVAAGAFVSFTPFLGFHFILAVVIAWLLGGNLIASAIGTVVGNPLSLPFIWGLDLELGRIMLYGRHRGTVHPIDLGDLVTKLDLHQLWKPLLLPMSIGGVVLGVVAALILYFVTRWATRTFQEERRHRLAERARRRADAEAAASAA
jgi:uncharacterized protein (DUF2062 family)